MNQAEPDVTFVIAAFNAEETIGEAVDAALAQQDLRVEVIVVDDHSGDGTADAARRRGDDRVSVVRLECNLGPGGARNAGFDRARGRWIAVLDADDGLYPDRSARLVARAEADGADIVVDNLEVRRSDDFRRRAMFDIERLALMREMPLPVFIEWNAPFQSTFTLGYMKPVLSRRFVEQARLRYDEDIRIGEDYLFLASALARGGRCAVEPAAGYVYNIRAGSVSRVLGLGHIEAMQAGDRRFARDNRLDREAEAALRRRARRLAEAATFLAMVDHLKGRAPLEAMRAALRNPGALRHLRMPIGARMQRMGAPIRLLRPSA
jgi:succinoglycan biosynthesis protein ExoO